MNDNDHRDGYPTMREALEDWQARRAPKDIVPHTIPADAPPIPTGPQTVTVTDFDEHGVTRTETTAWIAPAITTDSLAQRRKDDQR